MFFSKLRTSPNFRVWFIVGLAFVLCAVLYVLLWPGAAYAATDTPPYLDIARDLRDLRLDQFHVRAAGYGYLLLLTGSFDTPTRALFFVQLGMYFTAIALLVRLFLHFQVREGLIYVFLAFALLPYNVMPTAKALTEPVSQFLIVTGLALLTLWFEKGGWWRLLLSAAALAFVGITRPTYQVFSLGLAVLLLLGLRLFPALKRRVWLGAVVLAALAVAIIGSLCLHNYQSHGYFGVTPLFGFNLTQKTARVLEQLPDQYAYVRDLLIKYRDQSLLSSQDGHQFYNFIWNIPTSQLSPRQGMTYAEVSAYYVRMNLYLIQKAPLAYIQEVGYSLGNYWLPVTNSLSHGNSTFLQILWTALHYLTLAVFFLSVILILGLGLVYLALPAGKRRALREGLSPAARSECIFTLLALLMVFYTVSITVLVEMGEPRSRISTEPEILALAFLGVNLWFRLGASLRAGKGLFSK
jgi:hypothetical protein